MSEESKERRPQKLVERVPKGTASPTLDTARAAYIQLLGSLGSNAEVRAEVSNSIRCN